MLDKRLAAILLSIIMITSITTLAVPALSEDDEANDDRGKNRNRSDDDKDDSRDDRKSKKIEIEEKKGRIEYEIEIEDNMIKTKVEVRNFGNSEYRVAIECSNIPPHAQNPVLQGTLIVNNGRGEVEIREEIINGEYKDCTLYVGDRSFTINDFRVVTGEQERKRGDEGLEIKAEIIDNMAIIKIEDEFVTDTIGRDVIANLILTKLNLTRDDIRNILRVERVNEIDDVSKDRIATKVHIRDGMAKVAFKYRFISNNTTIDELIDVIYSRITGLSIDDLIVSMDARVLNKSDVKSTVEKVKIGIKDELLLRNIERLDRTIGNDRAIISMRLTLQSENNTRSFGNADMLFIKSNHRDIGRISITMITADNVKELTACYNGDNIGMLNIRDADEGFKVGTLKTFIDSITVNIPGVEVSIVEGNSCNAPILLSGIL